MAEAYAYSCRQCRLGIGGFSEFGEKQTFIGLWQPKAGLNLTTTQETIHN